MIRIHQESFNTIIQKTIQVFKKVSTANIHADIIIIKLYTPS